MKLNGIHGIIKEGNSFRLINVTPFYLWREHLTAKKAIHGKYETIHAVSTGNKLEMMKRFVSFAVNRFLLLVPT